MIFPRFLTIASPADIDSLFTVYENASDRHKAAAAGELFEAFYHQEVTDTLYVFDGHGDKVLMEASAHYWMAYMKYFGSRFTEALELARTALPLCRKLQNNIYWKPLE